MSWALLTAQQKATAVRQSIEIDGMSYSQAASIHGTTRTAIAGVASRARDKGQRMFKPVPVKRNGGAVNSVKTKATAARVKRKPVTAFVPLAADEPEAFTPKPGAWDALPGSSPVGLMARTGCAWVIGERPFLFCNEPLAAAHDHWCPAHVKLGTRPVVAGTPKRVAPKPERLKGMTS